MSNLLPSLGLTLEWLKCMPLVPFNGVPFNGVPFWAALESTFKLQALTTQASKI